MLEVRQRWCYQNDMGGTLEMTQFSIERVSFGGSEKDQRDCSVRNQSAVSVQSGRIERIAESIVRNEVLREWRSFRPADWREITASIVNAGWHTWTWEENREAPTWQPISSASPGAASIPVTTQQRTRCAAGHERRRLTYGGVQQRNARQPEESRSSSGG
ncbi:hypothetical protein WH47_00541 [Habropoda laboriosa]|uniref:Uncharacterized protein n=1 Tax=Habropoda laboriosa TaxID=597456 RepID=A0A0L7R490_9HYME|nr:hypothetical protein WH47_00541 [Habropoda laboriosa]